jgi:hypothetical protein
MWSVMLAQQSEYAQMWGLAILLVLLGILAVAIPRFRRVDLMTDAEKKKFSGHAARPKSTGHAGH